MPLVDLHTHSTASDGTDSPAELIARAASRKLAAVALTDHDTVAGIAEAAAAAAAAGLELVPGIEISTVPPGRPGDLHIIGYFIDPASQALGRMNRLLLDARAERNEKLIARLADLHVPVSRAELESISHKVVTRAHFADLMIRHRYVASVAEAFDRYLGQTGLAFVEKGKLSVSQALQTIHGAGGLAAVAHPVHLNIDDERELEAMFARLADVGLDAVEAFHPDHSPAWVRRCQLLAERFSLCVTGGSDYHGIDRAARPLGSQRVDDSFLAALKRQLPRSRPGRPAGGAGAIHGRL